jgi:hypothetical protein
MAWIDMMAQMATQGLPVNVGQLMDQLAQQQGGAPLAQGATGQQSSGVAGLVSGLKARSFSA